MALAVLLGLIVVSLLAQMNVTTKIGINGEVKEYSIPIYLKIFNFYDRHFNYQNLVTEVVRHANNKKEKTLV